jgi:hypothetical protein
MLSKIAITKILKNALAKDLNPLGIFKKPFDMNAFKMMLQNKFDLRY